MKKKTAVALGIGAAAAAFAGTVAVRAAMFNPPEEEEKEFENISVDKDKAIDALARLIRCKTVSYPDHSLEDAAEFEKLIALLPELYPNVAAACPMERFEDYGLLYKWQGRSEGAAAVLMAHFDVVPVEQENWQKPAFDALIEDGVMWGRGTLDTKVTMNGILCAADALIKEGYQPEHDIYFAFSGGEEVNGMGAVHIVDYFEKNGIELSLVLDEGGGVVENVFPGVKKPCALIGIAEKGLMNLEYSISGHGGHASAPGKHTPVGKLAMACNKLESKPFKMHITKPVEEMFDTLGRHSSYAYKLLFANLWCFEPLLGAYCNMAGGEINALVRTTVAFTQMEGSSTPNVIPSNAHMVSNSRLNPVDSVNSALERIRNVIDDEDIKLTVINGTEPSRISSTDCEGWRVVKDAVAGTWRDAIVSPYLMVQCSDSRHYGRISDKVYRFSAMALTAEERSTIHGSDERIKLENICTAVEFFTRVIKQL